MRAISSGANVGTFRSLESLGSPIVGRAAPTFFGVKSESKQYFQKDFNSSRFLFNVR